MQLALDTPPFTVGVHVPGFLQAFDAGPFTAMDVKGGTITIELPKPATLQLAFDPGKGEAAARPFKSTIVQVMQQIPHTSQAVTLTDSNVNLDSKPLTLSDISPGEYSFFFHTVPEGESEQAIQFGT